MLAARSSESTVRHENRLLIVRVYTLCRDRCRRQRQISHCSEDIPNVRQQFNQLQVLTRATNSASLLNIRYTARVRIYYLCRPILSFKRPAKRTNIIRSRRYCTQIGRTSPQCASSMFQDECNYPLSVLRSTPLLSPT